MGDPIQSGADLVFFCFAGLLSLMVAWRPRQTLARIFGRRRVAAASEKVLQFDQAMAALVAVTIAAMLIGHAHRGVQRAAHVNHRVLLIGNAADRNRWWNAVHDTARPSSGLPKRHMNIATKIDPVRRRVNRGLVR
jgi:hypothetical protein